MADNFETHVVGASEAINEILGLAKQRAMLKNRSVMKDKVKLNKAREIKEIKEDAEKKEKLQVIQERKKDQGKVSESSNRSLEQSNKILHSRMHNLSTNNWLRARHAAKVSSAYYYFPEETKKRQQMMAIFQNFDEDGNSQLEIEEFLDMFINTFVYCPPQEVENSILYEPKSLDSIGRIVTEEDAEKKIRFKRPKDIDDKDRLTEEQLVTIRDELERQFVSFYTFVTKKDYLSKSEFINLALDKDANDFFLQIMRDLTAMIKQMGKRTEMEIPYSFEKMISYLGYCTQRDNLYGEFKKHCKLNFKEASNHLEELLFLKSGEIKEAGIGRSRMDKYRLKFKGAVAGGVKLADLNCLIFAAESQAHDAEDLNIDKDGKKLMGTMFKSAFGIQMDNSPLDEETPVTSYARRLRKYKQEEVTPQATNDAFSLNFNLAGQYFNPEAEKEEETYNLPETLRKKIDSQVKKTILIAQSTAIKESQEILSKYSSNGKVPEFEIFRAKSSGNISTHHRTNRSRQTNSILNDQPGSHNNSRASLFGTKKQSFNIKHQRGWKSGIPDFTVNQARFNSSKELAGIPALGNRVFNWRLQTSSQVEDSKHYGAVNLNNFARVKTHNKSQSLARISTAANTLADIKPT